MMNHNIEIHLLIVVYVVVNITGRGGGLRPHNASHSHRTLTVWFSAVGAELPKPTYLRLQHPKVINEYACLFARARVFPPTKSNATATPPRRADLLCICSRTWCRRSRDDDLLLFVFDHEIVAGSLASWSCASCVRHAYSPTTRWGTQFLQLFAIITTDSGGDDDEKKKCLLERRLLP